MPRATVIPQRVASGAPLALLYSWEVGPGSRPLPEGIRAFVHFTDPEGVQLFGDDHVPTPDPASWLPGHVYSYKRILMTPPLPYVGAVHVQMWALRGFGKRRASSAPRHREGSARVPRG
jgi:hypothetical protein